MKPRIEFFYFLGSTYTYLSVTRAQTLADDAGIELLWRPFSVRTLMREQNNIPFADKPVKLRYMWRDLERRAAKFGVPYEGAPPYPIDADELANRVATLAASEGWCMAFTQAAYRAWFLEKLDPGNAEFLRNILRSINRDPERCLTLAAGNETRAHYDAATARARKLGAFGSPTFVVGTELFWGDDRLEDAIAWSKATKASGGT